jgi:hypothetical protein
MNILKALHREERKLRVSQEKIEGQLHGIRAAINAVSGNGTGKRRGRPHYKMSAAHRRAIRLGIARAKAGK